jgi:peptidoglycan/xylan/chitin deacetylase (PgdA/CDA1 family)
MRLNPAQLIHRMVYPALGSIGYFHSYPTALVTVITYHGVLPSGYQSTDSFLDNTLVTADAFRSHLRLLKEYYNVISPDDFLRWLRGARSLPERAIVLTCDDGLLNHLSSMVPILRDEGMKCLFFVTGASLAETPGMLWYTELYLMFMDAPERDESLSLPGEVVVPGISSDRGQRRSVWLKLLKTLSRFDIVARRAFLDEARSKLGLPSAWKSRYLDDPALRSRFQLLRLPELQQLMRAGMTVGAHTLSHPALVEQSSELARTEIAECRRALERSLGRQVWAIAYPFGDPDSVSTREYELAEEAGFECAFLNVGAGLKSQSPRFALPRTHITAEMSLEVYEAYISGFHDALRSRFRPQPGVTRDAKDHKIQ